MKLSLVYIGNCIGQYMFLYKAFSVEIERPSFDAVMMFEQNLMKVYIMH